MQDGRDALGTRVSQDEAAVEGCVGDYVYKPNEYEVGFGLRIRKDPDHIRMDFMDYSGFQPEYVEFVGNTVFFAETRPQPAWVFNCDDTPFLRFPDQRPKTVFQVRSVEGSVWDVAEREDWDSSGD